MQLSIIIVNYNVKYFLEQCLSSVVKACKNIQAEIFVIDNNSTDGSKDFFANRFKEVNFTWKEENVGFSKANNEVVKLATGQKILFLNPDTIVPEDCFEKCLTFFSSKKNIGAIGPKMIDGSGNYLPESKRGFPSLFTSINKMAGLTRLFPHNKYFARYYLGHLSGNKTNEVDVLAGACMMVDKNVLDETAGFDEAFFMYGEDIDLSYRIQKAGYRNYYFADTTIIHFKGESTQKEQMKYIRHFYGAMMLFVKKHYSKGAGNIYLLLLQTAIAAKATISVIKNRYRKISSQPKSTLPCNNLIVVSDEQTFQLLHKNLQRYFSVIASADKINQHATTGSAYLLCEPRLSFKEIISTLQEHQYPIFIHSAGTKGIVGSSDKNSSGIAIPV